MSLSAILNTASAGLSVNEIKIAVANANIANAGDASYSRKTVQSTAITSTLALSESDTARVTDAYLTRLTASTAADAARDQAISTALSNYDAALGTVGGGDDLSSRLQSFETALSNLSTSGADTASKSKAVAAAGALASSLRSLSTTLQSLRTQADSDISATLNEVNGATSRIDALNKQIVALSSSGGDVTDLEDQREAALQTLAADVGVSYFVTPDNRMQVYTLSGGVLVGDQAHPLSYTPASTLSADAAYPDQISGILLDGKDVTPSLSTGKLGGLVALRDDVLVEQQAKLDSFSAALIQAADAATNAGSAYPPPSALTGSTVVGAADALSASGSLRVVIADASGAAVSTTDLDLSAYSTVQDLVSALNSISGLSAQIDGQGRLSVQTADAGQGVAFADLGASLGAAGEGFSAYFGLNDLFTGLSAADIQVSATLAASPDRLPISQLSTAPDLAAGDLALTSGDSFVSDALVSALGASRSFGATAAAPAQTASLETYATGFVAAAAQLVSDASATADASQAVFSAAQSRQQNLTNVNTDEELAQLTALEQQYQANAQMISIVRSLFDALVQMMS